MFFGYRQIGYVYLLHRICLYFIGISVKKNLDADEHRFTLIFLLLSVFICENQCPFIYITLFPIMFRLSPASGYFLTFPFAPDRS